MRERAAPRPYPIRRLCQPSLCQNGPFPTSHDQRLWSDAVPFLLVSKRGGGGHGGMGYTLCRGAKNLSFLGCTERTRSAVNVGRAGAKSAVNTTEVSIKCRDCQRGDSRWVGTFPTVLSLRIPGDSPVVPIFSILLSGDPGDQNFIAISFTSHVPCRCPTFAILPFCHFAFRLHPQFSVLWQPICGIHTMSHLIFMHTMATFISTKSI